MAPIRKGDGTPLEIPGVQEVRSGDGRVFFDGDAIPDSELPQDGLQHEWYAPALEYDDGATGQSFDDQQGDFDFSASGDVTFVENGINDLPSFDYDDNNFHEYLPSAIRTGDNNEYTVAFVVDFVGTDGTRYFIRTDAGDRGADFAVDDGSWRVVHGGADALNFGTASTDPVVFVAAYDGSTVHLDINDAENYSGSAGWLNDDSTDEALMGVGDFADMMGHVAWWDQYYDDSGRSSIANELNRIWEVY